MHETADVAGSERHGPRSRRTKNLKDAHDGHAIKSLAYADGAHLKKFVRYGSLHRERGHPITSTTASASHVSMGCPLPSSDDRAPGSKGMRPRFTTLVTRSFKRVTSRVAVLVPA